eukprot:TRINITY_DN8324_c0_g3_i2.p1 TRINITY_DN8324_c0_g3~~TRINITY_DN8324_c0_g3_i2.p1  ORF type:complete len:356 (+),score=102.93 TRINITY_DN8324_c0_g3_i2:1418-2485(+)
MVDKAEEILRIEGKQLKIDSYDEDFLVPFRKAIANEGLVELVLSGNSYSPAFFEGLAGDLARLKSLKRLNINDAFVGRDKEQVPRSLETAFSVVSETLAAIDLSNNALGPHGATALAKYFIKGPKTRILLINNCGLGAGGVKILGEALVAGKVNLEVISIGRNRMEDAGVKSLSEALGTMTTLRDVRVYQNSILGDGMTVLLQTLNGCAANLETLDVFDNYIKGAAVDELCKLIQTHPKLHTLNVSDCNIKEEDNEKIVEALEATADLKLTRIGYNYNELCDSAVAKRFLEAILRGGNKPVRIEVKGNDFNGATKKHYRELTKQREVEEALSRFESDDEDEEEAVVREFAELSLN